MSHSLILTEELERIKFLSGYKSDELATEQKALVSEHRFATYNQHKNFISEQQKPMVKPGTGIQKPGVTAAAKPNPEQQKQINAKAAQDAQNIYNMLKKAFDMDSDNDLKDWDGTDEQGAVKAVQLIKDKNTLDALNKIIKTKGQFKGLRDWMNSEMSDFDHAEYSKIWTRLDKLGYKGAQYNAALNVGGKLFDAAGGKGLEDMGQALMNLKNFKFEDFMEGFRTFLNGLGGVIVQIMLSIFLPGIGSGINAFAWGALTIWDIYKAIKGKPDWMNIIIDLFGLVTNGIAAKTMAPAKAALAGEAELPTLMQKLSTKFPKIYQYVQSLGSKLMSGIGKITQAIENAIAWVGSKVSWFKSALQPLKNAIGKVGQFVEKIGQSLGKTAVGKVVNKAFQSMKSIGPKMSAFIEKKLGVKGLQAYDEVVVKKVNTFLKDEAKKYTNDQAKKIVCSSMGKQACALYNMAEAGVHLKHGAHELSHNIAGGHGKESLSQLIKTGNYKELGKRGEKLYQGAVKGYTGGVHGAHSTAALATGSMHGLEPEDV